VNYIDPTGLVPNVKCPVCKPPDPKPLPGICAKPPIPPWANPAGDSSGSGAGSGSGSGGSGRPEPDPLGGPVGKDRANQPDFGGPPHGEQPGPDLSIHVSGNTDSGATGLGGNVGSFKGDTSDVDLPNILNKAADAFKALQNQLNN